MISPKKLSPLVRFGAFSANLQSGELWKEGVRIRLQTQPFQILSMFLERPNQLITREDLQGKVWPSDTFVDFDQGLNKAINKLRDALSDNADNPHFIETVPRRGYRFIAPVVIEEEAIPHAQDPQPTIGASRPTAGYLGWGRPIALGVLVFAVAALFFFLVRKPGIDGAGSNSIAVLPLLAQGTPPGDYDLADGLTDGIINDLSLVPGLRVISHASVFQYKGRAADPQTVGARLDVKAVLTGKVTSVGDRLTAKLELTATGDGRHLWGQEFTRNISELGALKQEIAEAVADSMRLDLTTAHRERISKLTETDAEAQQLYLKGRYYFFKETPEDVLRARTFFQQSIDRDPTFALAYSALGDSYDWMATEGFQPLEEVVRQSIAAKSKSNELNDSSAEIHSSIGAVEFIQWHWTNAEKEFQTALRLNPNYFEAHHLYSIYLRSMRRFPEAIQHAILADHLNPLSMPARSHLALTYYYARQYDVAAAQYRRSLKDDPQSASIHAGLSAVLLKMGKDQEGIQELEAALSLTGDNTAASDLAKTYAQQGPRSAQIRLLRGELEQLSRAARTEYVSPVEFAYRYALLNDKENSFLWLEKAYTERSPQLFNLNVDPDFDNLRDEPHFNDLVSRLHLPQ
jgi:TolB-like protein/DNA-binding winged helix-turn-helix (wHTH) protein/Tfp pilus assembly protein PilF